MRPLHVAAWLEQQTQTHKAPTAKLRLAAIRHLFDWLVKGQIVPVNPAASVRGPTHVVRKGQIRLLEPKEARKLLDSIDTNTPIGLRDRALLALMVYSFARVGAALAMRVEDVYTERRRLWVRLREKGGKAHVMPCHHNLENYLSAYMEKTGVAEDPKGPLFRTIGRCTKTLTRTPLSQPGCVSYDRAPHGSSRHRNQNRQSQLPSYRYYGLSQRRRHARKTRQHGQPCQHSHDSALRPAIG